MAVREEYVKKYKERARELVSKMTLEEKVFQTLYTAPAIERLGVKAYNWWNEALHGVARAGVATVFPQAIGLAASFDENLVYEVADAISTEGRAKFNAQQKYGDTDIYKGLTFWSPNVNIFRDPRWGRGHETFGEDPYLTGRFGVRFIEGMQGDDPKYLKTAACAKHFAVHSGPEGLRHSFDAEVSKQDLYETYLPAFKACVQEAKVEAVMGAYNRTNGEPCCGSKTLLHDILREKWGFDGHVTSDCWAIKDFHMYHMVTAGPKESVALAMNNGCDVNCGNMFIHLLEAVRDGLVEEKTIDEAVVRLFTTRMKLGVFDDSKEVPFTKIGYDEVDSEEMRALNLKAARKIITLLKNENNTLPLDLTKLQSIGVIGPNADSRRALVGNYEGTSSEYVTVLEGIRHYVGDQARIYYSEGCHLYKDKVSGLGQENDRISEVKAVCEKSDVIIACMGLDSGLEGEEGDQGNQFASGDKPDLKLPGLQEEVLKVIVGSGKPAVLIVLSGSALSIVYAAEQVPAILQCWYPGAQGGRAIAEILFGKANPEGKLPVTFYRTTEELPEFTDYSMQSRTYRYMRQEALYPFGYGLSYTDFEYGALAFDKTEIQEGDAVHGEITLKNTGKMRGAQTVQIYIKAERPDTPNPQLKKLMKETLEPGEEKRIGFVLPDTAFALFDKQGIEILEVGTYTVYAGISQPDARSQALLGQVPLKQTITCRRTAVLETN